MSDYVPTIGLEVHAELRTKTKMFCDSKNDSCETLPNVNVCPICMAHPGTLPVINKEAVRHVLRVGVALGSKLADYTEFDRKNYFYPDLPKGYQISQYEYPLVFGGELAGVAITRVHLEEDTASSTHDGGAEETLIDYNRAGVPLMELVTEPVIESAEQAGKFARELQLLLRYLGASHANMEKGEMRVEANISVGKNGERGTKVEIKNLNSFNAMERAVRYEVKRQTELLKKGEGVVQETRGWDEAKQATFSQRIKEESADYRYFPDPDLPSLKISEISDFSEGALRAEMPELPWEKRARYSALGLKEEDSALFAADMRLGSFFDTTVSLWKEGDMRIGIAANYLANDIVKIIRDIEERGARSEPEISISAHNFREIIEMVNDRKISSRGAKDLLLRASQDNKSPRLIAEEEGLFQDSSQDLSGVIEMIIEQNKSVVEDYRAGKAAALQYLVGQGMKVTRGAIDPEALRDEIRKKIS